MGDVENMGRNMSKPAKTAAVLAVLFSLGAGAFWMIADQPAFTGRCTADPDAYLLDIRRMHGSDHHAMDLQAGDVLHVRFETEKGSLRLEILGPDGTALYTGNGKETSDFTVSVPQGGAYTVAVAARHARGVISIERIARARPGT